MNKPKAELYPVYLLYGPEDYLIEEEIQELLNRTLSQKERGLNLHLFSGEERSGQEIVQAAQTAPMFSRYRFVLISEADEMDEEKIEALLKYFENPSPRPVLLCLLRLRVSGKNIGERSKGLEGWWNTPG